eukprot:5800452-Amphidinium_carterae.1
MHTHNCHTKESHLQPPMSGKSMSTTSFIKAADRWGACLGTQGFRQPNLRVLTATHQQRELFSAKLYT